MEDLIFNLQIALYHIEHNVLGLESEHSADSLEYLTGICRDLVKIKNLQDKNLNRAVNLVIISSKVPPSGFPPLLERILAQIESEGIPKTIETLEKQLGSKKGKIPIPKTQDFYALAENYSFNTLIKKLTTKLSGPSALDMYGNGKVESKDFKLFVNGYDELKNGINTSACKLLDSLLITATAHGLNDPIVKLSLGEYMQMRGLKDEKETRNQVKRDIEALKRVSFEYLGRGKQRGSWLNVTLIGGISGIVNSMIIFQFSDAFFNSLKLNNGKYLFMFFPVEALRINDSFNPYSYFFARKITEHKRENVGKLNENIISVKTLISACATFPTYEEIMRGNRAVASRLIDPFERDMDALSEIFNWHYTGDQPTSYDEFMDSSVQIVWKDYPNTEKLANEKKKHQEKATNEKKLRKKIDELEKKIKDVTSDLSDLKD